MRWRVLYENGGVYDVDKAGKCLVDDFRAGKAWKNQFGRATGKLDFLAVGQKGTNVYE